MKNTIQQAAQNKPAAVAGRSVNQILNGIWTGRTCAGVLTNFWANAPRSLFPA